LAANLVRTLAGHVQEYRCYDIWLMIVSILNAAPHEAVGRMVYCC